MTTLLDDALMPWIGSAYRHINAQRGGNVLDFSYAGLFKHNRWNVADERTLYFAGDIGVAIAEWGRRFPATFTSASARPSHREVFRLQFRLDRVIDMRASLVLGHLDVTDAPESFRNMCVAQRIGHRIRTETRAQAMLVPSIAFLDDLARWNLVIFLDKMPSDTSTWITGVERVGPLS